MAATFYDASYAGRHSFGKWLAIISRANADFLWPLLLKVWPCQQRRQALSSGICGVRDDRYYIAELYLISCVFNKMWCQLSCSITLLNAYARSSEVSSTQSNTC